MSLFKVAEVENINTELSTVLAVSDNDILGTQAVSARVLYQELTSGNTSHYSRWVRQNIIGNDFAENGIDYVGFTTVVNGNKTMDYALTIDFAKELCMMSKCDKGKIIRKYFIECERKLKAINIPSYQISNPIERAKKWIEEEERRQQLQQENEIMKPKALFADAVNTSKTSILIGDLAKLLKQNGIETGQKRLFAWLRDNDYLIKSGNSRNMPTQKSMELGLFEIKEGTYVDKNDRNVITRTTKVTGKGQIFFVNKFLHESM